MKQSHRISLVFVCIAACRDATPAVTPAVDGGASVVPAVIAAPTVGERFRVTVVRTLAGDSVRLGAAPRGRQPLTLVNMWATWCGPCKAEFPDLQAIHEQYGPRGLRVIAVSTDQRDADVQAFLMSTRVSFLIGRDTANAVLSYLQESGLPQNVLIGPDGTILYKAFGLGRPFDPALKAAIDSALTGA